MDKFILITGGTKGIGKAVASCLGKAGYNLILTYASDQATAEDVASWWGVSIYRFLFCGPISRIGIRSGLSILSWRRIGYVWTALCSMRE